MPRGKRGGLTGGLRALLALCGVLAVAPLSGESAGFLETFDEGRLDPAGWLTTAAGDYRERIADVVDVAKRGLGDWRLRLLLDTRGTRDETVKFVGVRSVRPIRLRGTTRVSVEFDWNNQANGSYLSAAVVLSPHASAENPLTEADWLKVEYVGVPPGQTARMVIGFKGEGRERILFNEGWPPVNHGGRRIGLQLIMLVIENGSVRVWENSRLLPVTSARVLSFDAAYLYLQLSSHSNYPAREIYFDNVRVWSGDRPDGPPGP
jgi:hypothetical protein